MVVDWMMLNKIVKYRVYCVICGARVRPLFAASRGREHHGHQLQDNGCRDIRHDAQRENCQAAEVAAVNRSKIPGPSLPLLKEALQHTRIDARRGNVRTDAVDREQRQGEQHPIPQIGDAEEISECFDESIHTVIFDRRNTATRACLCV